MKDKSNTQPGKEKEKDEKDLEQKVRMLNMYDRFGLALYIMQEKTPEAVNDASMILLDYYSSLKVYDDNGNVMDGLELPSIRHTINELKSSLEKGQQISGTAMETLQQFGGIYHTLFKTTPLEGLVKHLNNNGLDINEKDYSPIFDYKDKTLQELEAIANKNMKGMDKNKNENAVDGSYIALQMVGILQKKNMLALRNKYLMPSIDKQLHRLNDVYKEQKKSEGSEGK